MSMCSRIRIIAFISVSVALECGGNGIVLTKADNANRIVYDKLTTWLRSAFNGDFLNLGKEMKLKHGNIGGFGEHKEKEKK